MHEMKRTYQLWNPAIGTTEYMVECHCGWKEKARSTKEAGARLDFHIKFPDKG